MFYENKICKIYFCFYYYRGVRSFTPTFVMADEEYTDENDITWTYTVNSDKYLHNNGVHYQIREIITEITIPYEIDVYTVTGITGRIMTPIFSEGSIMMLSPLYFFQTP